MRIFIVDDEPDAVEALKNIINRLDENYSVCASSNNPHEAVGLILQHKPDVVFLDIEMPEMSGFELLETLPEINFEIIFATAFEHYALQAIKNNAIDYIVKPISVTDVSNALAKAKNKSKETSSKRKKYVQLLQDLEKSNHDRIKITTTRGWEFIVLDELIRIEADGVYTKAYVQNGDLLTITKPIKKLEEELSKRYFFRPHRSHLINVKQVIRFDSSQNSIIMSDNSKVPLARRRNKAFNDLLKEFY
jgi:two-component system LytT family response regulator